LGKTLILVPAHIVLARYHDVKIRAEALQVFAICQVLHVIVRRVKIAVLVVVSVEKLFNLKGAAHGDAFADQLRMAQREVHRMISSEAAAMCDQATTSIAFLDERNYFGKNVILILQMARDTHPRMDRLVIPALAVYAIHA